MNNIEKIIIAKKEISNYFFENDIKSSCLAQSYLLYKYILQNITNNDNVKLIKGFIVNNIDKIYYGHFWVEYNDIIYDIATDTYLLYHNNNLHLQILNSRKLCKTLPKNIKKYKCLDSSEFESIRNDCYNKCLNGYFLQDIKINAPLEFYNKLLYIHNKLIN